MLKGLMQKFILPFVLPIFIIIILFTISSIVAIVGLILFIVLFSFFNREIFYTLKGSRSYSNKDFPKSLMWFEKIYALKNPKPKNLISFGYILLKSGNTEKSKEVFNKIFKLTLTKELENYAKSILALLYWKENNIDKAINTLEEIIKVYETTTVYGSLGYFYIEQGNLDKALLFNLKSYEYNDSNTIILDNLVQNYLLLNNLKKAEQYLGQLMKLEPKFPEAYYHYAKFQKEKGLYDEALESLNKASEFELSYLSAITKDDMVKLENEIQLMKD